MKIKDFSKTLLDDAYRLRMAAIKHSKGHELDPKTAIWVMTIDAWLEILRHKDYTASGLIQDPNMERGQKRLMGLPVRTTIDDDPDTPMIQLVMEPDLHAT